MAFPKLRPLYSAFNVLAILHLLIFWPSEFTASGYTTHLIPLDSPLSPFYNPSITNFDRLHDAFKRSLKRANHFKSTIVRKSKIEAPMNLGGGEYLMKMSLGTPPVEVIGIVDTGSDLIWTQCLPCIECYNQTLPLFNPLHSSSYHNIPFQSSFCNALEKPICGHNSKCVYSYSYGDGSHTAGNIATETLTLGNGTNSVSFPNIVFGCGHNTSGTFDESGSGIIGLGGGKLSLISQLGSKKFSYCLIPSSINSTSKISFGNDALVSGSGVVTTPIATKNIDTFYYLSLEGFSVGNKRIAYNIDTQKIEGNIIIDSGTTLTHLPLNVFDDLVLALNKLIHVPRVEDPNGVLSLCYKNDGDNMGLPIITAHFKGCDVKLQPWNTFSLVEDDVLCFTMLPDPDIAIYGNLAQMNFLIGYDLEAGTVSFKPSDCTKEH
ncbi:aspartic proteinase CDR1-like [Gastrolobium bilobum]|uniref:aspartic proteinase CDR1-like n=1 Tax=Gastrolobium bilobum TaxID=150636 RepID=UPI002AB0B73C|nr:aspartic proteinase CDR1-like [Gastrolobium bilobum]